MNIIAKLVGALLLCGALASCGSVIGSSGPGPEPEPKPITVKAVGFTGKFVVTDGSGGDCTVRAKDRYGNVIGWDVFYGTPAGSWNGKIQVDEPAVRFSGECN